MKRCKDCRFENADDTICRDLCEHDRDKENTGNKPEYVRKFWKFWRPK